MTSTSAPDRAATPDTSFRLLLQAELAGRCARNPQYSLRSFAAALGVDHSTLSQWLRGRRPMTARAIENLGRTLKLPPDRLRAYIARGAWDGPDMAILELLRLDEFRPDSRWIARVLDLDVDEVNMALQRLLRLGLLEMASRERWIDHSGDAGAGAAARPPVEKSSMTIAVNSAMLPRAFELVTRFRRELLEILQEGGTRDDVYQVEVALFPVTTFRNHTHKSPITNHKS